MLKRGKALGEDSITPELLKKRRKILMMNLKQLIIKIWKEEIIPIP